VKIVCILFICNLFKGYNQGTKSVVLSIVDAFYAESWMNPTFSTVSFEPMRQDSQETG
jgi:hypothetical protein